jgi:anti-anti-sigma factor
MIEIHTCTASTVVCPTGDLDPASSLHLRHLIADLAEPEINLIIDLCHVSFVDAVALSALVGSVRRVRSVGGTAVVHNANRRVRWLLGLTGVDPLAAPSFTATAHVEAA